MKKNQRYNFVFFGTPRFAEIVLKKLIDAGMAPSIVVCNPDKPIGRKKIVTPPPAKILAEKYNIDVWQPEVLSSLKLKVESKNYDFFIVTAYAKIIPSKILKIPRFGTIGVHPSLLPKYRGASPIQAAILNGDTESGTTLYLLDEEVDHGPILAQKKADIQDKNYLEAEEILAKLGGELLIKIIPDFIKGKIKPKEQNHNKATFTKKINTSDGEVDLKKDSAEKIYRKILALNPEPGVYILSNGKRVKLLEAELKNGELILKKIQFEGKNPTDKFQQDLL